MKIVALEEHYSTPQVRGAQSAVEPAFREPMEALGGQPENGRSLEEIGDMRIAKMDECGIDVQVLSLTTPGTQNLEPAQARDLARSSNDLLAEAVARHPDRFQGFATLPTPDPAAAAAELERCVTEFGFKGALMSARTRDRSLDQPEFLPILEKAAELEVPLFLHPQSPAPAVREIYYSGFGEPLDTFFAAPGFGWHVDTGIYALRLILSGVFDRLPNLQILLGHWGEVILFYLDRIDRLGQVARQLSKPISSYLRDNFYVSGSGILSQRCLLQAIEILGVDRIVYSTDYPYQFAPEGGARRFLMDAPIAHEDKLKIAHGNWERLTGRVKGGGERA